MERRQTAHRWKTSARVALKRFQKKKMKRKDNHHRRRLCFPAFRSLYIPNATRFGSFLHLLRACGLPKFHLFGLAR